MNQRTLPTGKPYKDAGLNRIYDLLFCDTPDAYRSENPATDYTWNTLLARTPDRIQLETIAADQSLEFRPRLLAYRLLAANGFPIARNELMGVVIEVAMPEGLDVLAAFQDGTARF